MKKRLLFALATLLTAATGAWAQDTTEEVTPTPVQGKTNQWTLTMPANDMELVITYKPEFTATFNALNSNTIEGGKTTVKVNGTAATLTDGKLSPLFEGQTVTLTAAQGYKFRSVEAKKAVTIPVSSITLNSDNTEATITMPASDVSVSYALVCDLTQQVAFDGMPTEPAIVKMGEDGKYQPVSAFVFQLIDQLATGDAQNITEAEGITVTAEKKGEGNTWSAAVSLADFLADAQPGTWRLVAAATDETSPYDGQVTSAEFTLVEKYDLAIQPANDYSKDKFDAVTVGGQAVTLDADGKAKTTTDAGVEVKLKAKRGYVIEKVKTKKEAALLSFEIETQTTIYYLADETWAQAITNHPTENAKWAVKDDKYVYFDPDGGTNYGTLFIKNGSRVEKDDSIDTSKMYTVEYDD